MSGSDPSTGLSSRCNAFRLRCLSGVVLLPLAVGAVLQGGWVLWGTVGAAAGVAAAEWLKMVRRGPAPTLDTGVGLLYLTVCFGAFLFIRESLPGGVWHAVGLLVAVAASDTGAYFTGKALGGPKLAPVISPKKTWAGFGGAVAFCGLGLWAVHALAQMRGIALWPQGSFGVLFLGFGLGAVAQIGDLFMSLHKRRAGAKDFGSLIPGHGGILDRVDALMLVCPAFVAVWLMFGPGPL